MKTLIYTAAVTGLLTVGLVVYVVWFDPSLVIGKLLVTLVILFVVQVVAYLVIRDLKDESSGKDDGTIAR